MKYLGCRGRQPLHKLLIIHHSLFILLFVLYLFKTHIVSLEVLLMLEITNPTQYAVAIYIRLSREDEETNDKYVSESITNQQSMLTTFAKDNKLHIYDTYIDDGYSGTTFDRPNFLKMIDDIENKKINMIITKDLSRLR
jgi:predicted GNAT family acetyltransferase